MNDLTDGQLNRDLNAIDEFYKKHPELNMKTTPDKEKWEGIAATTALDAHKKVKNYAQFSETIYQGIKIALDVQKAEIIAMIEGLETESCWECSGGAELKGEILSILRKER